MSDSNLSRRALLAGSAVSLAARPAAARPAASGKPNILVILMDDLGCHDTGFRGATDLRTPNINSIASSGVHFANWYSNAPVCAPARTALLTGRAPLRTGMQNGRNLNTSEILIPALLKPAGYATGAIGKWHLGDTPDTVPNAKGLDYYYGFHAGCTDYYSHRFYWGEPRHVNYHDLFRNRDEIFEDGQYIVERIADEAAGFIDSHASEPFFLYTAFNAVHYPMHAPRKYVQRFPNLEPERQMYAAMLSAADDGVGRILAALDRHGLRENTLIFFLGDNGATTEARAGLDQKPATAGSNAPYRGHKFSVFDGGMHVPGAMSWPGVIPKGQVSQEIAMTADILPTACKLAGVEPPQDRVIDGRDILSVAKGEAKSPHEAIYWSNGKQLAIRRGDWKLVIDGITYDGTPDGHKPLTGDDALFLSDLSKDPGETTNLRHEHPEMVDELSSMVHKWHDEAVPKNQ